jgi:hypothetical protein
MNSMFPVEFAVLLYLNFFSASLLISRGGVVSSAAFCALKCDYISHFLNPRK